MEEVSDLLDKFDADLDDTSEVEEEDLAAAVETADDKESCPGRTC